MSESPNAISAMANHRSNTDDAISNKVVGEIYNESLALYNYTTMEHDQPIVPREVLEYVCEYTPQSFVLVDRGLYRTVKWRMQWNFTLFTKGSQVYCVRMQLGREKPVDWMSMYKGDHSYSPRLLLPPSSCAIPLKFHPFVIGGDTSNYCIYDYQKNIFVTIPRIPIMYWSPYWDEKRIATCSSVRDNGSIIKLAKQYAHYWVNVGHSNASFLLTVPDWDWDDDDDYGDYFVGCTVQTAIESGLAYIIRHPGESWYEFLQQTPRCQSQGIRFARNMPPNLDAPMLLHPTCMSLTWDEVNRVFDGLLKLEDDNIVRVRKDLVIFAEVTNVFTGASAHIYTLGYY